MFGKNRPEAGIDVKGSDTYVNAVVKIRGDLLFRGSFYFDGSVRGDLVAEEEGKNKLILGKNAQIIGDVRADRVIIFGKVTGSIYSKGVISLMPGASVRGDIYYRDIDMRHGVSMSGRFHHTKGKPPGKHTKRDDAYESGVSAGSSAGNGTQNKEEGSVENKPHDGSFHKEIKDSREGQDKKTTNK